MRTSANVTLRPFRPGHDGDAVAALWTAALAPEWPLLPDGLAILGSGYVAEADGGGLAGVIATDPHGAVVFLAVAPAQRRRGLGRRLVERAVSDFRDAGLTRVTLGHGADERIWPGVPTDRADALAFFDALGWAEDHVVTDLVQDLQSDGAAARLAAVEAPPGITFALVDPADTERRAAVLRFEDAQFPEWSRAFRQSGQPGHSGDEILVAQDTGGDIAGTLLLDGPGRASPYWPLLGDDCATIGCVGVAPDHEKRGIGSAMVAAASRLLADRGARNCHIDWVVRVNFYARLGYRPWRTFSMRSLRL